VDTDRAMEALTDIAAELHDRRESLSALEWRTYAWARASLAVLTAIRVEESLSKVDTSDYPVTS
jgi:hypothetical protein